MHTLCIHILHAYSTQNDSPPGAGLSVTTADAIYDEVVPELTTNLSYESSSFAQPAAPHIPPLENIPNLLYCSAEEKLASEGAGVYAYAECGQPPSASDVCSDTYEHMKPGVSVRAECK